MTGHMFMREIKGTGSVMLHHHCSTTVRMHFGLKQHYEKEENLDDGLYEYGYVRIGVLVVLFQVQAPAWLDMG